MKLISEEYPVQVVDEAEVDVEQSLEQFCIGYSREEPAYICNVDDILAKHKNWIEKFGDRIQPFYAVKCNDSMIVLATLAALGTSFDCASKGEIQKVLGLGVQPERIIFANPTKPASHIRYAAQMDVKTMTFDSEIELYKIKEHFPEARLVIRIRCEAKSAQCPLGNKFGCNAQTEAPHMIKVAKSLGLNLVGVSFHVGSGCSDYHAYHRAIQLAKGLFEVAKDYGFDLTLLDIGGGFPGDKGKPIDEVAAIINSALDEFFPLGSGVRVIAEPGRYYVASAYTLVTAVQSKKRVVDERTGAQTFMYYINDGVYGSFNSQLYDHQVCTPKLMNRDEPGKSFNSVIFGPSCDGLDTITEGVRLPELKLGDVIVWDNMGAYTMVCASPFNGFPLPTHLNFVGRNAWDILQALFRTGSNTLSSLVTIYNSGEMICA